jgi:hypothetical protein
MKSYDFVLEDGWWVVEANLPSWREFQSRSGPYGAQNSLDTSSGAIKIVFAPEGRDDVPLTNQEKSLVMWTIEHEAEIFTSSMSALLKAYPKLRDNSGYPPEEQARLMPDVRKVDQFRDMIGLHSINVHQVSKHGLPYIGLEFGCTWEEEHGLGILMHGSRTVNIGGADTAILLWMAEEDAKKI